MRWKRSLLNRFFVRLLIGVLILTVPVMATMVLINTNLSATALSTAILVGEQNDAKSTAARVDTWVTEREKQLDSYATLIATESVFSLSKTTVVLQGISFGAGAVDYAALEIVDTSGDVKASSDPSLNTNLSGADWLSAASSGDVIVPLRESKGDLQWYGARPLVTGDGAFTGILVGILRVARLADLLNPPG